MTVYRHALWAPNPACHSGVLYGAPLATFKANFAAKVREYGVPILVWDADSAVSTGAV